MNRLWQSGAAAEGVTTREADLATMMLLLLYIAVGIHAISAIDADEFWLLSIFYACFPAPVKAVRSSFLGEPGIELSGLCNRRFSRRL